MGAREPSAVSLWESGTNVPKKMLRELLVELLDGRRWPELRAAMLGVGNDRLPEPWDRAVRWYRRASRERRPRETVGTAVAAILDELRGAETVEALRQHYCECDGDWATTVISRRAPGDEQRPDLRHIEDVAYSLRWLELAHGRRFWLGRSLVPQLPLELLNQASTAP